MTEARLALPSQHTARVPVSTLAAMRAAGAPHTEWGLVYGAPSPAAVSPVFYMQGYPLELTPLSTAALGVLIERPSGLPQAELHKTLDARGLRASRRVLGDVLVKLQRNLGGEPPYLSLDDRRNRQHGRVNYARLSGVVAVASVTVASEKWLRCADSPFVDDPAFSVEALAASGWRPPRHGWDTMAACQDVDPADMNPLHLTDILAVKALCRSCPVRRDCLNTAMQYRYLPAEVWGGFRVGERKELKEFGYGPPTKVKLYDDLYDDVDVVGRAAGE